MKVLTPQAAAAWCKKHHAEVHFGVGPDGTFATPDAADLVLVRWSDHERFRYRMDGDRHYRYNRSVEALGKNFTVAVSLAAEIMRAVEEADGLEGKIQGATSR